MKVQITQVHERDSFKHLGIIGMQLIISYDLPKWSSGFIVSGYRHGDARVAKDFTAKDGTPYEKGEHLHFYAIKYKKL